MYTKTYVHVYTYIVGWRTYIYTDYIHTYIHIYIHIYIRIYVHIYTHIYRLYTYHVFNTSLRVYIHTHRVPLAVSGGHKRNSRNFAVTRPLRILT